MQLAKVLAVQEAQLLDALIGTLNECKHLEEEDVVRLCEKCKVRCVERILVASAHSRRRGSM